MTLPVTDSFTGTNNDQLTTYSSNWSLNSGDFDIQSNALAPDAAITECGAHWNANSFSDDQYAKVTLVAELAVPSVGPAVRCAGAGVDTYYGLYNATTGIYIFKMVAGTWTQLGATVASAAVNDVLMLKVQGTTLTYNLNGTDRTTRTDSAIASGSAGVCGYEDNTGARMDNWEGGNYYSAVVSESVAITEAVSVTVDGGGVSDLSVSVSEAVGLSENGVAEIETFVSVSEAVGVSESRAVEIETSVSVSDTVGLSESRAVEIELGVSASETIGLSESYAAEVETSVGVSDAVGVSESRVAEIETSVSVSEVVGVSEAYGVSIAVVGEVSVGASETISVAESAALEILTGIGLSETVTLSEAWQVELEVGVATSEGIGVAENVAVAFGFEVSVSEAVAVGENAHVSMLLAGFTEHVLEKGTRRGMARRME